MIVALALPCLLGFVGLATDVGALLNDKRQLQTAADAAAIAGALQLNNMSGTTDVNDPANIVTKAALSASAANGFSFTDGSNGVTVTVNDPPVWPGSNYQAKGYVEVTVSKTESTIFMSVFGYPSVTVAARAVASNHAPGNGCIYGLGATGTDLSVQGNVNIQALDCSFNLASDGSADSPITVTGGSATVDTSSISVVGSVGTYKGFSPQPVGNTIPSSDPLSFEPQYACGSSGCTCTLQCTNDPVTPPSTCTSPSIGKNTTLSPGCYNGLSIGNNSVTLNAGTYFFNGSVSIGGNGSLTGTGVTLIFTSGALSMKGTPLMDITAPDSTGAFPSLLYYQVQSDSTAVSLGGTAGSTIEGIFYAPTAEMDLQGTPGGNVYTDFVVSKLVLAGDASFNSYAALPGGAGGLDSVALVE